MFNFLIRSYRSKVILFTTLIPLVLLSLVIPVSAATAIYSGTIDVSSPTLPTFAECGTADTTRYQSQGAFTVDQSGLYDIEVTEYTVTTDRSLYRAMSAYIATDLSMNEIIGYWEDDEGVDPVSSPANLTAGEFYYIFAADCSLIETNVYDSVDYTFEVSGTGNIEPVPGIDAIPDTSVIEGSSETINISVIDDSSVTIGFQVFDKDDTMIPDTDPLYSTFSSPNGKGDITFTPEIGDAAGSPYEVTVTALDNDMNLTTRTFNVDVVATETVSFSGVLNDASPSVINNTEVHYVTESTFTPATDGIYTIDITSLSYGGLTGVENFSVVITSEPTDFRVVLGGTQDDPPGFFVLNANLKAGETYYLSAIDLGSIANNGYTSATYEFDLIGPADNSDAPIIEPIRYQYAEEGRSLLVAPTIVDDNFSSLSAEVRDKNGTLIEQPTPLYSEDNQNGTVTFTPQGGDADGSPYQVRLFAFDQSGNLTSTEFTLVVFVVSPPAIDPIDDQTVIELNEIDVDVNVVDDDDVDISFRVRDKNNRLIFSFDPLYDAVDNGDNTGTITFTPQFGDAIDSPYSVTVTARDINNRVDSRTFSVTVEPLVFTGTLEDADAANNSPQCGTASIKHYDLFGAMGNFEAPSTGVYTLLIEDFTFNGPLSGEPTFSIYITDEVPNFSNPLGSLEVTQTGLTNIQANLVQGETYFFSVNDCSGIADGDYTSVDYQFTIADPNTNPAPLIDTLDDLALVEEANRTVDITVDDDGMSDITFTITDKDANEILPADPLYSALDNGDNTGSIIFTPQLGDAAASPYTVEVSVTDDQGLSDTQTFTLTVVETITTPFSGILDNTDPFVTGDACAGLDTRYQTHGSFVATADGLYTLLITDFTPSDLVGEAYLSVLITEDETNLTIPLGYTEDVDGVQTSLIANLVGGNTYYISATDCAAIENGDYTAADYDFNLIGPENNAGAPIIDPILDQDVAEEGSLTVDVNITDNGTVIFEVDVFDKDNALVDPAGPFFSQMDNGDGTGTATFTPTEGDIDNSPYTVVVTATDDMNILAVETFELDVTEQEEPQIDPIADVEVAETATLDVPINAIDLQGDDISLSLADGPSFASVDDNGDGTGDLTLSPEVGDEGIHVATILASDGENEATLDVTITVTPNQKPVFVMIDDLTVNAGETEMVTVEATDPEGQAVSYRLLGQAANLDFVTLAGDTITISPTASDEGTYTIIVEGSDGFETKWEVFELTVEIDVNDKPVFVPIPFQLVPTGDTVMVTAEATDPEGEDITYRVIGAANVPDFITWDGTDTFTIAPTGDDSGEYSITVEASDGVERRWETFKVIVDTPGNDKPFFETIDDQEVEPNDTLQLVANAIDPEGQSITYRMIGLANLPDFMTWDGTDTLDIAPGQNDSGLYTITIEASDGVERRWERFTIRVLPFDGPGNDKPVFDQVGDYWIARGLTRFLRINAIDPEGEDLTYTIVGGVNSLPDFVSWNPAVPRFRIAPRVGDNGVYTIRVQASDGVERRWMTFRILVVNPPN